MDRAKQAKCIRQLECATLFTPWDPRIEELLQRHPSYFPFIKEFQINIKLREQDDEAILRVASLIEKWKNRRCSYKLGVGIQHQCCGMKARYLI
jgi:hypothetical protein